MGQGLFCEVPIYWSHSDEDFFVSLKLKIKRAKILIVSQVLAVVVTTIAVFAVKK